MTSQFAGALASLYDMYKKGEKIYSVQRMPLIREGLKQKGKPLFQFYTEKRSLNINWEDLFMIFYYIVT